MEIGTQFLSQEQYSYRKTASNGTQEKFTLPQSEEETEVQGEATDKVAAKDGQSSAPQLYYEQVRARVDARIAQAAGTTAGAAAGQSGAISGLSGASAACREVIPGDELLEKMGTGFVQVGTKTVAMTASQIVSSDSNSTIIRVRVAIGQNQYKNYDVDVSKVDPRNASDVEIFAICEYQDEKGTGIKDSYGRWNSLQLLISDEQFFNCNSINELTEKKSDWLSALSGSETAALSKASTSETQTTAEAIADIKERILENSKKAQSGEDDDDWRTMDDDKWEELLNRIDEYIEQYKEDIETRKEKAEKKEEMEELLMRSVLQDRESEEIVAG